MPTSHEMDRTRVFKYLDSTQEASNFATEIGRILWYDKISLTCRDGYARTNTAQHAILTEIIKNCDSLLNVLQPIRQDKSNPLSCDDLPTATLIQNSLWIINRENWIQRDAQSISDAHTDASKLTDALEELGKVFNHVPDEVKPNHEKSTNHESETYEAVSGDYPTNLIDSIAKLRDAVAHAADSVKPKRGNSTHRNSNTIRKSKLARDFVRSYWMCFKKFPPITIDGSAYNAFVEFLHAASLSDTSDDHYFKKHIENGKKTYGKMQEVMSRLEQSGTTKGKA